MARLSFFELDFLNFARNPVVIDICIVLQLYSRGRSPLIVFEGRTKLYVCVHVAQCARKRFRQLGHPTLESFTKSVHKLACNAGDSKDVSDPERTSGTLDRLLFIKILI